MNDDSIATHTYCHVLSVLLTGQKNNKKKKEFWALCTKFAMGTPQNGGGGGMSFNRKNNVWGDGS